MLDVLARVSRADRRRARRRGDDVRGPRRRQRRRVRAPRARTLGFEARVLSGDEEARLTFAGATSLRHGTERVLVIDVGGGSTELVLGRAGEVIWHTSLQVGVVRHSERHLHSDPPTAAELDALREDVRLDVPADAGVDVAIAVAGTPTQCAAIDLGLTGYDPARIEGHVLTAQTLAEQLDRLAALPLAERRECSWPGPRPRTRDRRRDRDFARSSAVFRPPQR